MGLIGYVIFFVSDCVEMSDVTFTSDKAYKVRIVALVAAAGNCLLLLLATVLTFPHVKSEEPVPADDAAEPAAEPSAESEA